MYQKVDELVRIKLDESSRMGSAKSETYQITTEEEAAYLQHGSNGVNQELFTIKYMNDMRQQC